MNLKALEQKASVLTSMIISVGEIYHASDNENDRNQIETGRYNLVTQIENGQLRAYQKLGVFESEIDSYQKAGVELVNLNGIENQFLFDEVPSLKRFFNRPEYLLN